MLVGGRADDRLVGGAGSDTIEGGAGDDRLTGGDGDIDTMSYAGATARVVVDLRIATQQDTRGAGLDTVDGFENLTDRRSTTSGPATSGTTA